MAVLADRTTCYHIEIDREDDGRWIAEVMELPGVMVYGDSQEAAIARAKALALRVLADQIESDLNGVSSLQFAIT